jgi:hypothetical protein
MSGMTRSLESARSVMQPRLRDPRRVEAVVLAGSVFALVAILVRLTASASRPAAAAGALLLALGSLLTAPRMWANGANDRALAWAARQIAANRFGLARLLDGSLLSLLFSTVWLCAGIVFARAIRWSPESALDWVVAMVAIAFFWSGAALNLASMALFTGRILLAGKSGLRGHPLQRLGERLRRDDLVWTAAGIAILVGSVLQLSAA